MKSGRLLVNNKKRAFTLIELLVVISIIGMLASVVLVSLNSARQSAKLSKAFQTMSNINQSAFSCRLSGYTLVSPVFSGVGGDNICSNGSSFGTLPNISDTGFQYCGSACGGWASGTQQDYGISAFVGATGSRKVIICSYGSSVPVNTWYYGEAGYPIGQLSNDVRCYKNW